MTHIKTRAFVGFIGLIAASFLAAGVSTTTGCGSDDSTGGTSGGAGTTGSGGNTGNAGATGSGGSTAGGCTAAAAALISDFGSGTAQIGTPYTGAETPLMAPMAVTTTGSLVISVNTGMATTMYPYAYVGLPFNACTSAAAYTGVKFNISGTLAPAGCTIQFSAIDKAHSQMSTNPLGTCTAASCYPSAKIFPLPATATDVTVLFSEQTGGGTNPGAPALNPAEILNIQWQFNVATGTAGGCTGTVTIDNITFI